MLQLPTREQRADLDERVHHHFVGGTIFAEVFALELQDFETLETWRLFGETPLFVDGERDALLAEMLRPDDEVVGAVTRRGVHEARTRVVGDVIAR